MTDLNTAVKGSTVNRRALISVLGLFVLLWFISNPQLLGTYQWLSQDHLYQQNQQYLAQIRTQAQQDFGKLAALTGLLEVAQSSQIGVSFFADFNVDVGNAVAALTRLVERGGEVAMASTAVITVLSLVSDTADAISGLILKAALGAALVWQLVRLICGAQHHQALMRGVTGLLFSTYLLLHLVLPYSLHIAQGISDRVSADLRHSNQQSLTSTHLHLAESVGQQDLKRSAQQSVDKLKTLSSKHINQKVDSLASYVINSLTLALFDLVLLPGLLIFLLYRAVVLICRHILSLGDDEALQHHRVPVS